MKHRLLTTLMTCACLMAGSAAIAQSRGNGPSHGGPSQSHGNSHNSSFHGSPPNHDDRFDQRVNNRNGYEPRKWNRGDRLPSNYRGRQYVVNDWHQHHLAAPPRGQQWVSVGADYFLIAAATGLIAQAVFGN